MSNPIPENMQRMIGKRVRIDSPNVFAGSIGVITSVSDHITSPHLNHGYWYDVMLDGDKVHGAPVFALANSYNVSPIEEENYTMDEYVPGSDSDDPPFRELLFGFNENVVLNVDHALDILAHAIKDANKLVDYLRIEQSTDPDPRKYDVMVDNLKDLYERLWKTGQAFSDWGIKNTRMDREV